MATHLGWGEAKVEEGNAAHAAAAHTLLNAWVTNTPITGKLGEIYLQNLLSSSLILTLFGSAVSRGYCTAE